MCLIDDEIAEMNPLEGSSLAENHLIGRDANVKIVAAWMEIFIDHGVLRMGTK